MIGRCLAAAACVLSLVSFGAPARANPLDAFGFGARSIGLSGAVTALAEDVSANYYNPAGLAAGQNLRLELGYVYVAPMLRLNGRSLNVDESRGFQGGLVLSGEVLGQKVGASVGIHLPDRLVSRIRSLPQQQPRFVVYDNRPQRVVITTSVAVETFENLFIGAGLTFLANTKGVVDMTGTVAFFDDANTELFSSVDVDLQSVRYPSVGLMYRPDDAWSFGITWREEFNLRLEIDVVVTGDIINDMEPDPTTILEDGSFVLLSSNNNLFSPRQLAFGVAYRQPCWLVSFDLTWVQWSRFPSPTATVDIALELGDLPFRIPPIDKPLPPDFHDIWVPRVGVEGTVVDTDEVDLQLRGGYFYEPTPAPDQPGRTNYVDTDKHQWSFGMTLKLGPFPPTLAKPMTIDLAAQLVWMPERAYVKSSPADPIGDYTADGLVPGFSATLSMVF